MLTFLIDGSLSVSAAAWVCVACAVYPDVREWVAQKLDHSWVVADIAGGIRAARRELGLR